MARFVLFRSKKQAPAVNIEQVVRSEGGSVLDQSSGRAYLVEVNREAAETLRSRLIGWIVEPETEIDPPH